MTDVARDDGGLEDYYALGLERDRLTRANGALEFARSTEIILRRLPPPPGPVADIGGGPGRYTMWLAQRGYQVEHRDLMPLHVRQLEADTESLPGVRTAVGDARALDLQTASVSSLLLLGPLYHLRDRADRLRALGEARRVVRPGGVVFVAAISRWATRTVAELRERMYLTCPEIRDLTPEIERSGWLPPLFPGAFSSYCHRPGQLRAELREAGLQVADLVNVEGPAHMLDDLDERMNDPVDREVVLAAARAVERVPELLGAGPHLLATAIRLDS
jgi:SAM-dependent methyltransferase